MLRRLFRKRSTSELRKAYLMAAQDDINTAVAAINNAATTLTAAANQLTGLGIPAPVDTSGLSTATAALSTAVSSVQSAVTAEAAKITAPPP
jgi:hypothetical protein